MKSIKSKILVSTILTVMISLLLVGGISCFLGYKGTQDALKNSMEEMAVVAAERVSYQLEDYKTIASETGAAARWSSLGNTLESKKALLQSKADAYGFKRYNLLDKKDVYKRQIYRQSRLRALRKAGPSRRQGRQRTQGIFSRYWAMS